MATRISIGSGTLAPTPVLPWAISGTVNVGDVVYQVSGANRTVARASASDSSKRPPIGVVIGKSNSTVDVAVHGEKVAGLSGLVAGTTYWLGADGALVDTRPASNAYVVGLALSSTEFLVDVLSAEINASGGGGGGVTSAGIGSADASFATSGGPVTGSGSIDVTLNTVAVADGGTGLTSAAEAGAMLVASGSGAYVSQNVSPFQRNRLINGAHMVSQRNADRPVSPAPGPYTTDRWIASANTSSTSLVGRMQGWSNYFDGSGDYLVVPDSSAFNFGSGDFTIECWVQMVGTENPGRIINYWNTSTTTAGSWQILCASGTLIRFMASVDGVATSVQLSATGLTTLTWYHVAVVRSGSSFSMYINGNLAQSATASVTLQTANTVTIGARRNGASYAEPFNGYVSNARIVKGTALYTSNFTPLTTPLVPVANTSLLTCGSEIFQDQSQNNFTITPVGNAAVSSLNPFTAQAPTGSVASLRWSVTSATAVTNTQYAVLQQRIEGTSVYDFAWGSASAKAVTLSFWVRSSVAGTYCAQVRNAAANRCYIAEYSVSAANTWEKKIVSIPGDTSGTWPTTTAQCMALSFDVGSGSDWNGTAGVWQAGNYSRTTNQTNFIGTALSAGVQSNDFAISNVQLELGSVATPFEFRPMQAEVALCQRYYARLRSLSGNYVGFGSGTAYATNGAYVNMFYPVPMRSAPTINHSATALYDTTARQVTSLIGASPGLTSAQVQIGVATVTQYYGVIWCGNNNPNAYVELNAEL